VRLLVTFYTERTEIVGIECKVLHLLERLSRFDGNHMVDVYRTAYISAFDAGGFALFYAPLAEWMLLQVPSA